MDVQKLKNHLILASDNNSVVKRNESEHAFEGASQFDQANFGSAIRRLRNERGWTLRDLSERSGVSQSTLSRVETGQITLSFDRAHALARALDVGFSQFLVGANAEDAKPTASRASGWRSITRRGEGHHVVQDNLDFEYLCVDFLYRKLVTGIVIVRAHSLEEHGPFVTHPGEEFLHVLDGTVLLSSDFYAPVSLGPGDSIQFDPTTPHAFHSTSKEDARVLFSVIDPRW